MWTAAFWGGVAGSAVFIGSLVGLFFTMKKSWIGAIMAFGTGVLIGAASFELLLDSIHEGGLKTTTLGFLGGALLFTIVEFVLARKGGKERKRSRENPQGSSGMAIFFGTIIDAIPESVIIGVSLLEGGGVSWLLVIAIFISNFPEGLSSSVGLKKDGYSNRKILFLWGVVLVLSALSSLTGYVFLEGASDGLIAFIGAFAAGGVIAMVTAAMMPEAYEEGGAAVGFIASVGLLCSLILTHFQ
ncbi:ZIP family metal transporter [Halobacillus sp. ACCC02827]|uniref:ZIP family metal transporter n=1 Tax=Bacillaceae TaxID=186817 RepID=UPI00040782C8|nr:MULTISPECIES: ZIP family metal transporter [Bacillaceae]QHT47820.1 ZIP family metal transporter [Bacillus sp. SB49]WJE15064.1 ZIP family metal transporter [Halobacillus sp. ACCC02827]